MATISQMTFSNASSQIKYFIFIQISLKYVPKGLIINMPALVQMMAWCRTGNKSSSELMMADYIRINMHCSASMG